MNRGGFSWNRFLGISRVKYNISRKTGIPWTRSGWHQKVGRLLTRGCMPLVVLGLIIPTLLFLGILWIMG